jgi:hypothetical protein
VVAVTAVADLGTSLKLEAAQGQSAAEFRYLGLKLLELVGELGKRVHEVGQRPQSIARVHPRAGRFTRDAGSLTRKTGGVYPQIGV